MVPLTELVVASPVSKGEIPFTNPGSAKTTAPVTVRKALVTYTLDGSWCRLSGSQVIAPTAVMSLDTRVIAGTGSATAQSSTNNLRVLAVADDEDLAVGALFNVLQDIRLSGVSANSHGLLVLAAQVPVGIEGRVGDGGIVASGAGAAGFVDDSRGGVDHALREHGVVGVGVSVFVGAAATDAEDNGAGAALLGEDHDTR